MNIAKIDKQRNFGSTWWPAIIIGPSVFLGYRAVVNYAITHTSIETHHKYPISSVYVWSLLFLLTAFLIQWRVFRPEVNILGTFKIHHWLVGLSAVFLSYIASILGSILLGYGREPAMLELGSSLSHMQYLIMILSILVMPPIVEELAYRHFLFTSLPINNSRWIAVTIVLLTAIGFAYAHSGYVYWTTQTLMLVLGLILGIARVCSGGLLLPIALHSFAEMVGMSSDYIWSHW